jgi:long-subunit fatty acid transport protein
MKVILTIAFYLPCLVLFSQSRQAANYGSFTGAIGNRQGSVSIEYFHVWNLGKANKIEVGVGGRFTSYFGSGQYYSSAPASLANDVANTDSLLLQSAQINALNAAVNIGYRLSKKLGVGFNIDALGFSFGGSQRGSYINETQSTSTVGKPTGFNLLLVGNNDQGSLNSEFYLRYFFADKIGLKIAYQYLFTEYTTETKVQQVPETNDRFRNKASLFSVGVTKKF